MKIYNARQGSAHVEKLFSKLNKNFIRLKSQNKVVLVFFCCEFIEKLNLYDVVKEIKKGRDNEKIIKRSILDYLKNPVCGLAWCIVLPVCINVCHHVANSLYQTE